ncbi:MAG TPA: pyridoxamine 5'-phosphate oxidase family protein [Alphaproteobacteria bacterium]|nr:pyridoxamine 5'-phosphate oxidase family protein [Alphaproteobacteria bacterium]
MSAARSEGREAEQTRKLWQMVRDIKIAMMTTRDGGVLRSRPMECVQVEDDDGTLWFFTGASSPKAAEVAGEHEVCLCFVDRPGQNYVSISGFASILRDRTKARELWTEDQRAWYPRGLDDPELALLKVRAQLAEYWDRPSSAMIAAQGLVRALADETPDLGENAKLSFEPST